MTTRSKPSTAGARKTQPRITAALPVIGWREWVALPDLGIKRIKAKVDTGARSSSLHAVEIEEFRRSGAQWIRFVVHPDQRSTKRDIVAEAELLEHRMVRSSNGKSSLRPVIITRVELAGVVWPIELTLAARPDMGFRMLLGREAVRGRFLIDPAKSYRGDAAAPKPRAKRRKSP